MGKGQPCHAMLWGGEFPKNAVCSAVRGKALSVVALLPCVVQWEGAGKRVEFSHQVMVMFF